MLQTRLHGTAQTLSRLQPSFARRSPLIAFCYEYWIGFNALRNCSDPFVSICVLSSRARAHDKTDVNDARRLRRDRRVKRQALIRSHPQVKGFRHV